MYLSLYFVCKGTFHGRDHFLLQPCILQAIGGCGVLSGVPDKGKELDKSARIHKIVPMRLAVSRGRATTSTSPLVLPAPRAFGTREEGPSAHCRTGTSQTRPSLAPFATLSNMRLLAAPSFTIYGLYAYTRLGSHLQRC